MNEKERGQAEASCSGVGCIGFLLTIWVLFHLPELGALLERLVNQAFR